MNRRTLVLSVIVAAAAARQVDAQFLGDALASAGLNVTEYQAGEMIAASGAINDPSLSGAASSAPATHTVQSAETVGTDVGVRPRSSGSTTSASPSSTSASSASSSSPTSGTSMPAGSATGFAGARAYAASIDPKEAAAWHDAFRPIGTKLQKPPTGANKVESFGETYYYSKGMFLKEGAGGWTVVAAPLGAIIPEKPVGAATVFGNGKPHTYYAGTFYVYDAAKKGYAVVQPPIGATVDYLPEAAKKAEWKGATHYEYGGTHYRPYYRGSSLVYTVAGS